MYYLNSIIAVLNNNKELYDVFIISNNRKRNWGLMVKIYIWSVPKSKTTPMDDVVEGGFLLFNQVFYLFSTLPAILLYWL